MLLAHTVVSSGVHIDLHQTICGQVGGITWFSVGKC